MGEAQMTAGEQAARRQNYLNGVQSAMAASVNRLLDLVKRLGQENGLEQMRREMLEQLEHPDYDQYYPPLFCVNLACQCHWMDIYDGYIALAVQQWSDSTVREIYDKLLNDNVKAALTKRAAK